MITVEVSKYDSHHVFYGFFLNVNEKMKILDFKQITDIILYCLGSIVIIPWALTYTSKTATGDKI